MKILSSYLTGLLLALLVGVISGANLSSLTLIQGLAVVLIAVPYAIIIYLWFFGIAFKIKWILASGSLSALLTSFLAYLTLLETNGSLNMFGAGFLWLLLSGGIYYKFLNRQNKTPKTA